MIMKLTRDALNDANYSNERSLLQNIASFIGLFCKRDLKRPTRLCEAQLCGLRVEIPFTCGLIKKNQKSVCCYVYFLT